MHISRRYQHCAVTMLVLLLGAGPVISQEVVIDSLIEQPDKGAIIDLKVTELEDDRKGVQEVALQSDSRYGWIRGENARKYGTAYEAAFVGKKWVQVCVKDGRVVRVLLVESKGDVGFYRVGE